MCVSGESAEAYAATLSRTGPISGKVRRKRMKRLFGLLFDFMLIALLSFFAVGCMQGGDTSIYTDSGGGTATGTGGNAGQEQGQGNG